MPVDRVYDGNDLLPALRSGVGFPRRTFYYFRGAILEGVREDSWKLRMAYPVQGEMDPQPSGPPVTELFNLDYDPAEQYNVWDRNKERGGILLAKMKSMAKELGSKMHVESK